VPVLKYGYDTSQAQHYNGSVVLLQACTWVVQIGLYYSMRVMPLCAMACLPARICRPRAWWEPRPKPLYAQPNGNELYILLLVR